MDMDMDMSRLTSPATPPSGTIATAGVFSVVSPLPTLFPQSIVALSLCQGGGRGEWKQSETVGAVEVRIIAQTECSRRRREIWEKCVVDV